MWCRLKAEGLPWTQLMDESLLAAHADLGASAQDISQACAKAPLHPAMYQVRDLPVDQDNNPSQWSLFHLAPVQNHSSSHSSKSRASAD